MVAHKECGPLLHIYKLQLLFNALSVKLHFVVRQESSCLFFCQVSRFEVCLHRFLIACFGFGCIVINPQLHLGQQKLQFALGKGKDGLRLHNLNFDGADVFVFPILVVSPFFHRSFCARQSAYIATRRSGYVYGIGNARVVGIAVILHQRISRYIVVGAQCKYGAVPRVKLILYGRIHIVGHVALEESVGSHQVLRLLRVVGHIYPAVYEAHVNAQAQGVGETLPLT